MMSSGEQVVSSGSGEQWRADIGDARADRAGQMESDGGVKERRRAKMHPGQECVISSPACTCDT